MENKFSDSYSVGLYYPMNLGGLAIACETVLESNISEHCNLTDEDKQAIRRVMQISRERYKEELLSRLSKTKEES